MDIAKEYQENEKLIASLDSMYGSGSAKYMIQMSVTDGKERRAFEEAESMHSYYSENKEKIKKGMNEFFILVSAELEDASSRKYHEVLQEIWDYYEANLLDKFPYIGGDEVSGTRNLTGAYYFVAMGEVLKKYGLSLEESGHLMVLVYERYYLKMPGLIRTLMGKIYRNPKILNKMLLKKDAKNAANAVKNPGSFETQTQIPPEEGYDFSYHNLVCPLSIFAKKYGYEEYMPYLCNLDYVMFGVLGAPLYREHTCFEDGDFCDFKLKNDATPLPYWPPVFSQDNPYK
ncbi:L-2-amino-thiazoline-4-carboxylic acid hydrolase [Butyrivibrio fibrisolvens]|nr:L-2-amino-thiazoline-4-carboxylic acid hydrolase [Butyrivibrio fibrisolvens]